MCLGNLRPGARDSEPVVRRSQSSRDDEDILVLHQVVELFELEGHLDHLRALEGFGLHADDVADTLGFSVAHDLVAGDDGTFDLLVRDDHLLEAVGTGNGPNLQDREIYPVCMLQIHCEFDFHGLAHSP